MEAAATAVERDLSLIKALVDTLSIEVRSLDVEAVDPVQLPLDLHEKTRQFETRLIKAALLKSGGKQSEAARLLGTKPSTLNAKIKVLGINVVRLARK